MKKIGIISLFIMCAAGFFLFPKKPTLLNVKLLNTPDLVQEEIKLKADLIFVNPNYYGLTLKNHDIDVFVNEKKVSNLSQSDARRIPAKQNFEIPVNINFYKETVFGSSGFLSGILKSIVMQELIVTYKGTVEVEVLGFGIPIEIDYTENLFETKETDKQK